MLVAMLLGCDAGSDASSRDAGGDGGAPADVDSGDTSDALTRAVDDLSAVVSERQLFQCECWREQDIVESAAQCVETADPLQERAAVEVCAPVAAASAEAVQCWLSMERTRLDCLREAGCPTYSDSCGYVYHAIRDGCGDAAIRLYEVCEARPLFECGDGQRIDREAQCDGHSDCDNGADDADEHCVDED